MLHYAPLDPAATAGGKLKSGRMPNVRLEITAPQLEEKESRARQSKFEV
jgi:hypothetical protein